MNMIYDLLINLKFLSFNNVFISGEAITMEGTAEITASKKGVINFDISLFLGIK